MGKCFIIIIRNYFNLENSQLFLKTEWWRYKFTSKSWLRQKKVQTFWKCVWKADLNEKGEKLYIKRIIESF